MLVKLERPRLREDFCQYLQNHMSLIVSLISQNLSLWPHQQCLIADRTEWTGGDFNICIPVSISNWRSQRLMMRCPLPYMFDDAASSTEAKNIDEKLRCEAANHVCIPDISPRVPVPHLWGFGLPRGLSVRMIPLVLLRYLLTETTSLHLSFIFPGICGLLNI